MIWIRKQGLIGTVLVILIAGFSALRLCWLSSSPPGFYIDEAAISAQVICLRQSGTTLLGDSFSLFTPVLGGGYLTITYALPAIAWTSIFGDSVSSFRAMSAFFSVLLILGTFVFGTRLWKNREAGFMCALAAALSPWIFQFARIAWDPSIAPVYLVWAFALLWSSSKFKTIESVLSGVLFALAAYCYPPLRVQIAIALPFALLGLYLWRGRKIRDSLLVVLAMLLVASPLIFKTLTGEIQGRFEMLSVFNSAYLIEHYGSSSSLVGLRGMLDNFRLLFSPDFLFFTGDHNLRHSTGSFGIWSWFDVAVILASVVCLGVKAVRRPRAELLSFEMSFVVVAYLAGVLPAAMTWESNPHALRSFGAAPFLALGVGGTLVCLWQRSKIWKVTILSTAALSFGIYANFYFRTYPTIARAWFDTDVAELAAKLKTENRMFGFRQELEARGINYAPMATTYYMLSSGAVRCPLAR